MGLNNLQTGGTGGISPGGLRNLTEISAIPDNVVNNMDHYYPTGEGAGTTLTDNGASEDFAITSPNWVSGDGRGGFYLDYDGSNTYCENTNGSVWSVDTFTWLLWINPDTLSSSQRVLVAADDGSTGAAYDIDIGFQTSNELGIFLSGGDGGSNISISTSAVSADAWNCVVMRADNGNQVALRHGLASDSSLTTVATQNYDSGTDAIGRLVYGERVDDGDGSTLGEKFDGGYDFPMANVSTALTDTVTDDIFANTKGNFA